MDDECDAGEEREVEEVQKEEDVGDGCGELARREGRKKRGQLEGGEQVERRNSRCSE